MKDFIPGDRVTEITENMRRHYCVVVLGHGKYYHVKTALAVCTSLGKNPRRRAEISCLSDWHFLDKKRIDVVLLQHPFGEFNFEARQAKRTIPLLDKIRKSLEDCNAKPKVVIVSRMDIFNHAKREGFTNEMFDNQCCVCNNVEDPVDLTEGIHFTDLCLIFVVDKNM